MNNLPFYNLEFVNYDELSAILYQKYNATDDEIRYWIKRSVDRFREIEEDKAKLSHPDALWVDTYWMLKESPASLLLPFQTDLPSLEDDYLYAQDEFFYPEYYYYLARDAHEFTPPPHMRFVYFRHLAALRSWASEKIDDTSGKKFDVLVLAQRRGLLRCYDKDIDDFTFYKTFRTGIKESKRLWADTDLGLEMLNDPETFFLLEDIIRIERCIFRKSRAACLEELKIELAKPDIKVVKIDSN